MIPFFLALTVGLLFAAGSYLMMHRNALRVIIAVMLLSNAVNLAVLGMSGDPRGKLAPLVDKSVAYEEVNGVISVAGIEAGKHVDPLPQALVLTAIVINFGVMAFLIALVYCSHAEVGTVLLNKIDEDSPYISMPQSDANIGEKDRPKSADAFLPLAVSTVVEEESPVSPGAGDGGAVPDHAAERGDSSGSDSLKGDDRDG